MISTSATILLGVIASANVQLYEFTADWCGGCQQMQPTISRVAHAGVDVRQVDFDTHRHLAAKANVDRLPTFIVVSDGQEVDRIVGAASFEKLMNAVDRASTQTAQSNTSSANSRRTTPVIRGQQDSRQKGIGSSLSQLMDRLRTPGQTNSAPQEMRNHPDSFAAQASFEIPASAPLAKRTPAPSTPDLKAPPRQLDYDAAVERAMAATVRLRVTDREGTSLGTGTIIDIHEDEALILTCGHIFDDSKGTGTITCDLNGGTGRQKLPAKLISYDSRRDIGLVSVRPGADIQSVPVGGPGNRTLEDDRVFSIGCNHGDPATINHNRVIAVNRYHGAANLVVGGRPVNGRSGGGLFDAAGRLIGVCNAADQEEDEGLYAALGPVHAELDSAGLGFIYRRQKPFLAATPPTNKSSAIRSPSRMDSLPRSPGQPAAHEPPASEAEVICIVRPKNYRNSEGQAYVIDHPSPELMNRLSEELARRGDHAFTGDRMPSGHR